MASFRSSWRTSDTRESGLKSRPTLLTLTLVLIKLFLEIGLGVGASPSTLSGTVNCLPHAVHAATHGIEPYSDGTFRHESVPPCGDRQSEVVV